MKLFIIGNGFDKAHSYQTGYSDFREYLIKHNVYIGSFNIADIFNDASTDDWTNFEELLGIYNFVEWGSNYSTDIYINDEKEEDRNMSFNNHLSDSFSQISVSLQKQLCTSLCLFIEEKTKYNKNSLEVVENLIKPRDIYLTFNYSLLLERIYKIKNTKICHIHGTIYDESNIIFGHSENCIKKKEVEFDLANPENQLSNLNYKLKKDYQFEKEINFIRNKFITKIIIMGHGLGKIDKPYFEQLNKELKELKEIIYFFYYDSNIIIFPGRKQNKDEQKEEKVSVLKCIFPGKKIKIIEW